MTARSLLNTWLKLTEREDADGRASVCSDAVVRTGDHMGQEPEYYVK